MAALALRLTKMAASVLALGCLASVPVYKRRRPEWALLVRAVCKRLAEVSVLLGAALELVRA